MKNKYISLLIPLFISIPQQNIAGDFQTSLSIQEAIHHYIASNLPLNTEYKVKLGQLDNRLKLQKCADPLSVSTHHRQIKPGRNSLAVKCNSEKTWTIYNSAIIYIYKNVIVITQPLRRGEIINANNLQLEKRELSTLRSGYLTNSDTIVNKQANRNLSIGAVINKSSYSEPKLIKRGEQVTIKTGTPNLNISMAGIAMMDGIKGQNIRVKNIKSKQIVHAMVIQQGEVAVVF